MSIFFLGSTINRYHNNFRAGRERIHRQTERQSENQQTDKQTQWADMQDRQKQDEHTQMIDRQTNIGKKYRQSETNKNTVDKQKDTSTNKNTLMWMENKQRENRQG